MKILHAVPCMLVWLVASDVSAFDPATADALAAQDIDHTDHVSIEVFRLGTTFTLRASCGGCILDLYAEDWLAADSPRARAPRDVHLEAWSVADVGEPNDEVTFSLDERIGVFASNVVVLLELESGFVIEKSVTLFGDIDEHGKYTPIDWQTWACRSQKARCVTDSDGTFVIVLSEVVR
jgi:hypothetical protein